jgi:hypothetical protein
MHTTTRLRNHPSLAIIAAPVATDFEFALPTCLSAVTSVARAGGGVRVGPAPGLGQELAEAAAGVGGRVTVALPGHPPSGHWAELLRIVHGRSVRIVSCADESREDWAALARTHYPGGLPAPLTFLAAPHAAIDGASLVLLLHAPGAPDPVVDHATWLCRLLGAPAIDLRAAGGLDALRRALGTET